MKLTIELVPRTAWYKNLRIELSKSEWDKLRKATYAKAGNVCEICGGKGPKWPVECHEIWEYDEGTNIQTLKGLVALCPKCHQCKHVGLAQMQGHYDNARKHLAEVNGISINEAEDYINDCFDLWEERSQKKWKLNKDWLDQDYTITGTGSTTSVEEDTEVDITLKPFEEPND